MHHAFLRRHLIELVQRLHEPLVDRIHEEQHVVAALPERLEVRALTAEAGRSPPSQAGRTIADEEVDGGADLLIAGDMGIGNTTPATT